MNTKEAWLRQCVPRSPNEAIDAILTHDANPVVTLTMQSGQVLMGTIVARSVAGTDPVVALHVHSDERTASNAVAYCRVADIEVLVVHRASDFADLLTDGAVEHAHVEPAPTRLGLARRVLELEQELAAAGVSVALRLDFGDVASEAELASVAALTTDTTAAIQALARQYGPAALAPVSEVRFTTGRAAVTRDGASVTVSADFGAGRKGRLHAKALELALASLL